MVSPNPFESQPIFQQKAKRSLLNIIANLIKYLKAVDWSRHDFKAIIQTNPELCNDLPGGQ